MGRTFTLRAACRGNLRGVGRNRTSEWSEAGATNEREGTEDAL